ncbi:pyridoxal phosphate-dependent transferase [Scheffersomyces coipomensis]|uniref:pyridoxal phosphate-dependent transferase n=1 Tax=Scheffersomyces coipomensis TaxID=1788519 RepID=UPI00315D82F8
MFDLKQVVRPNILSLEPYRCARDDFKTGVLLDANENTYGPALSNISEEEKSLELNRYPDPHQIDLKQQIINFRNSRPNVFLKDVIKDKLTPQNLCLGVGSDESIDLLLRCICKPSVDKMLICPPTYGMYSICATVNDVEIVKVPLLYPSFQIDIPSILKTLDENVKLVYLTSPGNPTGKLIQVKDVITLLESSISQNWQGLIVVDEAYIDFTEDFTSTTSESVSTLVNQYPNLVVLQTLSKSFGLAGIRLGITYSSTELAYYLNAMKYPYNISSLTSNVAMRATNIESGLKIMYEYVSNTIKQRQNVLDQLQTIKGIGRNIGGLDSNFILVEVLDKQGQPSNEVAQKLYNELAVANEVVVRFRGKEVNCEGALRITIGTADENQILIDKLKQCLAEINK